MLFLSIYTSKKLHPCLGGMCVSLCIVNNWMWLYAFSHVEAMQALSSLCLGPSGNSLCSQALIIHSAGVQGPIFLVIYHGIGFLCVLLGWALILENTPLLQGERWMRLCAAFRFSFNEDPFAVYIKCQIWQFIWQLPNFQADLEKNRYGQLHDFR